MTNFYLDTNFFLYLSNFSSPFYTSCQKLIKHCKKEKILLSTSTETIQEIIHYTKNTKQLDKGLKISKKVLKLVDEIFSIDKLVIDTYLKYTATYKTSGSRDLIHLAVCTTNKVGKLVTFDKDFTKFKEIKVIIPDDVV